MKEGMKGTSSQLASGKSSTTLYPFFLQYSPHLAHSPHRVAADKREAKQDPEIKHHYLNVEDDDNGLIVRGQQGAGKTDRTIDKFAALGDLLEIPQRYTPV